MFKFNGKNPNPDDLQTMIAQIDQKGGFRPCKLDINERGEYIIAGTRDTELDILMIDQCSDLTKEVHEVGL